MKKLRTLFVFFFLLSIFLFSNIRGTIFAQTEVNLTVSPPVAYLHVAPGTSKNHTVILENSGTTPITVLPTLVDFTTDGKTGQVIVANQLTFPYVSIGVDNSVTEVTIPPQKKAQLTLYIDVPNTAEEKEYPLTVLFFSQSELEKNKQNTSNLPDNQNKLQSNSQITAAIGSNLVVLVAKQNKLEKLLTVLDIETPKIIDSFQKLSFYPVVQNNSFGATTASGSAKIVNWRKQTVAEFEIYPDVVLGHNSRELRALLSNSNLEKPEIGSFSYKPKLFLGPYQIVVTLTNETGVISEDIKVIYAFPFIICFTVLIGIGISLYFSKK